jgi:bifunctional aspartokinase / homoserine dehydrogenase 1
LGERMSVRLLTTALEAAGCSAQFIESTQIIVTDNHFQNAHPDIAKSTVRGRQVLEPLLDKGIVPVVTGFIGATPEGVITTLGRGGSDYSAGILGALLPADEVWIWTDVNGVMSADPRLVPQARTIPEITYREIAELAYFGAKVLHPKTIRPVIDAGIGLRICNTFNPQHPGTRLLADSTARNGKGINGKDIAKAVTAIGGQSLVTVEGRGMLGVPGVAARTFEAVASTGTSVTLISQASSEQSICFAIPITASASVVNALENAFAVELSDRDIDRIWATEETAIITVVGAGMIHTPGVAGRVFTALGERGVNVIAIAQGSSEVSISLMVTMQDVEDAVKAVHGLIVIS